MNLQKGQSCNWSVYKSILYHQLLQAIDNSQNGSSITIDICVVTFEAKKLSSKTIDTSEDNVSSKGSNSVETPVLSKKEILNYIQTTFYEDHGEEIAFAKANPKNDTKFTMVKLLAKEVGGQLVYKAQ